MAVLDEWSPPRFAGEQKPAYRPPDSKNRRSFRNLRHARLGRCHYNLLRPHSALGYRTPIEFANRDLPVILG